MPILLCHVIWMPHYQGEDEKLANGFDYVREEGFGGELFNFLPVNGTCYGSVPAKSGTININRLGAETEDDFIEGVLVVWTATDAERNRVVVGWYRDARVYRHYQHGRVRGRQVDGRHIEYLISARSGDCTLVPADQRDFVVPHGGTGLPGHSPVFYPEDHDNPEMVAWLETLAAYIEGWQGGAVGDEDDDELPRLGGGGRRRTPDPVHNAEVEKSAVATVRAHFKNWKLKDRQKDNCGWDLECRRNGITHCVEVKGLSGSDILVELTPNEYDAMKRASDTEFKTEYRLAVVTEALGDQPKLGLFAHDRGHRWRCQLSGRTITVEPREGARLR